MEKYLTLADTLFRRLCPIPAPSHAEDARAQFCLDTLKRFGAESAYMDKAKNVLLCLPGQSADTVVFAAHTDVVFPDTAPLPFREDESRFYCPGCGDDTVAVALLLANIKALLCSGKKPKKTLLFALNACEEGLGNLDGTRAIMEKYGKNVTAFFTLDGRYDRVVNKSVGSARYRVTVHTEGGHSYNAFGHPNAAHILAEGIAAIYRIPIPTDGGKTTYNVGTIRGGTSVNTIAQEAEMLCEYRSDCPESFPYMENAFTAVFDKMRKMGAEIEVTLVGKRPTMQGVDKNAQKALTELCVRIQEKYTGLSVVTEFGSTDCNIPHSMGIPAVCAGVYMGGGAHTREEWLEKASIPRGFAIVRDLIEAYV